MAIVDKLKSLYVKLGGDEKESASNINEWLAKINDKLGGDREGYPSNIEDWIDKIEDVAGSGGSGGVTFTTIVDGTFEFRVYDNNSKKRTANCAYLPDGYSIMLSMAKKRASSFFRVTIDIDGLVNPQILGYTASASEYHTIETNTLTNMVPYPDAMAFFIERQAGSFSAETLMCPVKVEVGFIN